MKAVKNTLKMFVLMIVGMIAGRSVRIFFGNEASETLIKVSAIILIIGIVCVIALKIYIKYLENKMN